MQLIGSLLCEVSVLFVIPIFLNRLLLISLKMDYKWSTFICLMVFSIGATLAEEDLQPVYDYPPQKVRYLYYKMTNVLQCNITGLDPTKSDNVSIQWIKNEEIMEPSKDDPPRYVFQGNKLIIHKTREEDLANYTCLFLKNDKRLKRADITTEGIPTAKVMSQETFIEGQKIHLECLVAGKPTPTIEWRYGNTTFTSSLGRIKLLRNKNNVPNAILEIDSALMTDRGDYTCSATNSASEFLNLTVEASTFVRVKAKLAALWPFIGICVEVIVLCAIIFIYERKRNKAELDESDTDQSPEQKNTPDHGKESVRQRK